jgi:hypothetical protein
VAGFSRSSCYFPEVRSGNCKRQIRERICHSSDGGHRYETAALRRYSDAAAAPWRPPKPDVRTARRISASASSSFAASDRTCPLPRFWRTDHRHSSSTALIASKLYGPSHAMATIAVFSLKGGVGKTTLATTLAWWAATGPSGRRTLLWDLDPQAAASWLLSTDQAGKENARAIFTRSADADKFVRPTRIANLSLLSADRSLRGLDRFFQDLRYSTWWIGAARCTWPLPWSLRTGRSCRWRARLRL